MGSQFLRQDAGPHHDIEFVGCCADESEVPTGEILECLDERLDPSIRLDRARVYSNRGLGFEADVISNGAFEPLR